MCEKVEALYNEYNELEKKEDDLTKQQYLDCLKAIYRKWLQLLLQKDVCTKEMNNLGKKLQLVICLN